MSGNGMHGYVKAGASLNKIYLFLFLVSLTISIFISYFIRGLKPESFIDYIKFIFQGYPFIIFGALYTTFDKWLWKLFSKWLEIANLNGKYQGAFKTSHDNFTKEREFTLEIEQTFSKISIKFRTDTSSSESLSAYMEKKGSNKAILVYNYQNEPKDRSISTLTEHKGTAWLKFDLSTMEFEGFYYTDKRPVDKDKAECNYGEMKGKKI